MKMIPDTKYLIEFGKKGELVATYRGPSPEYPGFARFSVFPGSKTPVTWDIKEKTITSATKKR